MIHHIRRDEKKILEEEALEILDKAEYGVLSTVSETGEPYGVPLNHCLIERNIYFHSATKGHKVDNIEGEPRVSFCTIGEARIIPDEFSTAFESAIAFGTASEVFDQEKRAALEALLEKYSPDFFSKGLRYMEGKLDETRVFKISINRITGKSSK